jgi:hypothetical protein
MQRIIVYCHNPTNNPNNSAQLELIFGLVELEYRSGGAGVTLIFFFTFDLVRLCLGCIMKSLFGGW